MPYEYALRSSSRNLSWSARSLPKSGPRFLHLNLSREPGGRVTKLAQKLCRRSFRSPWLFQTTVFNMLSLHLYIQRLTDVCILGYRSIEPLLKRRPHRDLQRLEATPASPTLTWIAATWEATSPGSLRPTPPRPPASPKGPKRVLRPP